MTISVFDWVKNCAAAHCLQRANITRYIKRIAILVKTEWQNRTLQEHLFIKDNKNETKTLVVFGAKREGNRYTQKKRVNSRCKG